MKSQHSYHSGKPILVDECQKISITDCIRAANQKIKTALLTAEAHIGNKAIELVPSKTAFDGVRYWFKCPLCRKQKGTLFAHPLTGEIGCRGCLGLDYRSRRYKGMIEGNSRPRTPQRDPEANK
jgi:hypothetical protein